jgi:hypothetical protein
MNGHWEHYHRRTRLLHQAADYAERTGSGDLPWGSVPGLADEFADRTDLLLDLQSRWERMLGGQIEMALDLDDDDLADSVRHAWQKLAARHVGLRRIIDRHAHEPALAYALRAERRMLAVAAGLATLQDPHQVAAARGAALVNRAKPGVNGTPTRPLLRRLLGRDVVPT